jgi:hypothetical protein
MDQHKQSCMPNHEKMYRPSIDLGLLGFSGLPLDLLLDLAISKRKKRGCHKKLDFWSM